MAKGKSLNPADAQRKAERKKELKKNKTERQKNRDFALVKKDTTGIEEDIQRLEKAETDGVISGAQKIQLSSLRVELARINKKKDEWVVEHPEHRKLVYRAHYKKEKEGEGVEGESKKEVRKVFNKHGIPRHPERSVYYDPIMNPFGVPPPGMPYMERPLLPDEMDSQAEDGSDEDEDGSDDEIVMPTGPPPSAKPDNDPEADSDDDIPMPEGPPPSKELPLLPVPPPPPLPAAPHLPHTHAPSFPPNFLPPLVPPPGFPAVLPMMGFPPFPPSSFPPPGFPPPPPPAGFNCHPPGWTSQPPRPRLQSDGSMQDPLTSVPHQTFQAYRAQQANTNHPLPDKPTQGMIRNKSTPTQGHTQPVLSADAGTISAPAQLRDLKKESTAFVPSSLKRKKPGAMNTSSKSFASRINAAPEASRGNQGSGNGEAEPARPDLLGALKTSFPAPITRTWSDEAEAKKQKLDIPEPKKGRDDYKKFMEEIDDIL